MRQLMCAVVAASYLTATPALAAVELDQANIPETGYQFLPSYYVFLNVGTRAFQQTFTVGKSGELDRIELAIANSPDLPQEVPITIELFKGNGPFEFGSGYPTPLASQILTYAGLPGDVPDLSNLTVFDLSPAQIGVKAGDVFTFSLRNGSGARLFISPAAYAGDTYETQWDVFPRTTKIPGDIAFRSYVAVPEPTTWAMMILGFGAIGSVMRGRRRLILNGGG